MPWSSTVPASSSRRSAAIGSGRGRPAASSAAANAASALATTGSSASPGSARASARSMLHVGAGGRHPLDGLGQLGLQAHDAVEQCLGLGDRVLRGPAGDDGGRGAAHRPVRHALGRAARRRAVRSRAASGQTLLCLRELGLRGREQLPCLVEVAVHRFERGGRVASLQRRPRRLGLREPGDDAVEAGPQAGHVLRRPCLQARAARRRPPPGRPAGRPRRWRPGRSRRAGRARRARPRARRRRAAGAARTPRSMSARDCSSAAANPATASSPEVGARGGELLLGGAHGVVHLDQGGAGPVGEVGGRDVANSSDGTSWAGASVIEVAASRARRRLRFRA